MSQVLDDLLNLLHLEPIEQGIYRGQSQDLGFAAVFGGQVMGQALSAAKQTIPEGPRSTFISQLFSAPWRCSQAHCLRRRKYS